MLLISNFYPVLQQPRVGWKTRGPGIFFFPLVYSAVTQGSPGIENQMLGLQNHLKPLPPDDVVVQSLSCDPMDCSTPGFPDLHCLPEFAQTHVQ